MRFRKPLYLLMVLQTMFFILSLSGTKMMALPRQEDADVAEAHTEVATVVTVASITMENVEDIEEATMLVTVEDTEEVKVEDTVEAIVEDTVEATAEATEVTSEAPEVANEVENVVLIFLYLIVICI
jgi:hypothetical protein